MQADFLSVGARGGRGSAGREGARGGCGGPRVVVAGRLSERVKACSQTVGEGHASPFIHTGAYNLQHVINHCCVWG